MAKKQKNKQSSIDDIIDEISKRYGDGALQKGRGTFVSVDAIPTGVVNIDVATGCGGLPRSRIIEIYGNESSGKTTLCLQAIASCQEHGGIAAFIDAEHSLDPDWAEANGVDMDQLLISQPDSGDEALNIVETLVAKKAIDLVVVDSVAALVPKAELDGEVGDHHVGAQARLLSQAMRKLVGKAKRSNAVVLFVNQLREKIGQYYGNPEQTPGGRALKFYSSMRIEVRRKTNLVVNQTKVYGMLSRVKIVKNKVAPPFQSAEFEIHFGQSFQIPHVRRGIFKEAALLDGAMKVGALRTGGSFYYLGDEKKSLANGKDKMIERLFDDRELNDRVSDMVYKLVIGPQKYGVSKNNETDNTNLDLDD